MPPTPSEARVLWQNSIGFHQTNREHILPLPFLAVLPLASCEPSMSLSFLVSKTGQSSYPCGRVVVNKRINKPGMLTAAPSTQHYINGRFSGKEDLLTVKRGI